MLRADAKFTALALLGQHHVAFQLQLIGIAQQQGAVSPALPVGTFGLEMEARIDQCRHSQRRVML